MKDFFYTKNTEKGQGLVEAVVSLAIIGLVMIGITSLTIRTIRVLRANELEDVATQAMVESLDFLKAPGVITADVAPATSEQYLSEFGNFSNGYFFRLDDTDGYKLIPETLVSSDQFLGDKDPNDIDSVTCKDNYEGFMVSSLHDNDYNVCVQVFLKQATVGTGYDIYVIGVWDTPEGTKRSVMQGFRSQQIALSDDGADLTSFSPSSVCNGNNYCASEINEIKEVL